MLILPYIFGRYRRKAKSPYIKTNRFKCSTFVTDIRESHDSDRRQQSAFRFGIRMTADFAGIESSKGVTLLKASIKMIIFAIVLVTVLSGCNLLLPRVPGLYVLSSGLGEFENRPTWIWEVYGPDLVQEFRYSLNDENSWVYVGEEIREYRPEKPLAAGKYTLYLQAKSPTGLWSSTVSKTATVVTFDEYRPDDYFFSGAAETGGVGQWALEAMGMPALWGYLKYLEGTGTARKEIVVAVIDTGYTEHPDLIDNLLTTDGYDFISNPGASQDGDPGSDPDIDNDATDAGDGGVSGDNSWHGTAVAGTIAALTDNGSDIAGYIAGIGLSKLKILPVRALGYDGGTTYDIAQAIRYAAGLPNDSGTTPSKTAKIINLSLGSYGGNTDSYIEPALAAAASKGIIAVASAGNERAYYGATEVDYPASSQYTIAVAATTYFNTIASYSNPGLRVDISAPGGSGDDTPWTNWIITLSADPLKDQPLSPADYTYVGEVGTSFSCPHVAGILALLCTVDDSMDLAMAKEVLKRCAIDLGPEGWDWDFGYGLVDALPAFGQYKLLLAAGWTPSSAASRSPATEVPPADEVPAGALAEDSLIVRYVTEGTAKSIGTAGRLKTLGAVPTDRGFGRDRVVRPNPGKDPVELRKKLMAEPDIEAVFYNFKYRPL